MCGTCIKKTSISPKNSGNQVERERAAIFDCTILLRWSTQNPSSPANLFREEDRDIAKVPASSLAEDQIASSMQESQSPSSVPFQKEKDFFYVNFMFVPHAAQPDDHQRAASPSREDVGRHVLLRSVMPMEPPVEMKG